MILEILILTFFGLPKKEQALWKLHMCQEFTIL